MILECVVGVLVFVVTPLLGFFLVPCYKKGRRFRSGLRFEIWVKWREFLLTRK